MAASIPVRSGPKPRWRKRASRWLSQGELVDTLNREEGIKAFLTRDKDEFLSLPERVQIARQHGAKLFISVHADTLRQRDIRGATVYTISDKASDQLAANLAERENLSDEIAGIALSAANRPRSRTS